MRLKPLYWLALLSLPLLLCPAGGAAQEKAPAPPAPTAAAEKPDPKEVLRRMCDYLNSLKEFSFKGEITDDHTYSGGKKLQFAFALEGYVKRPDKIRLNAKGDLQSKEIFYDGKTLTIYDTGKKFYGVAAMPATIDEALAKAKSDYGVELTITELANTKLFQELTEGIKDSLYVGEGTVFGVKCQHVAFDYEKSVVQFWVDASDKPVIRKVVLTYKNIDYVPQWTAYLTEWNVSPQLSDSLFAFTPPEEAKKADFLQVQQDEAPTKKKSRPRKKGDQS